MTNNFDYRQEYLQVDEIIPPIFKTDPNIAIMNSSINRMLTKEDTINVVGKIGKKNKNDTSIPPNLPEIDVHRQAYQLQPLVSSSFATVESITSFKDILNKLHLLGVDLSTQDIWGECERFTFAPPIHLDKFVNYRDYYWTSDSAPDYVTIHNKLESMRSKIYELEQNTTLTTENRAILLSDANTQLNNAENEYNSIINPASWVNKKYVPKYHWISSNKWVHKSDIHNTKRNIIFAKPAKHPIIEFFDDIEVNLWTKTTFNWLYRANPNNPWAESTTGPTDDELVIRYQIKDIFDNSFQVAGDLSGVFVIGKEFMVNASANSGKFVVSNVYVHDGVTEIFVKDHLKPKALSTITITTDAEFLGVAGDTYGVIIPLVKTSKGDPWLGVYQHWMVVSSSVSPINEQHFINNGYSYTHVIKEYGFGEVFDGIDDTYDGESTFTFDFSYILDTDDIRVYVNGIRQYGTYDEINSNDIPAPLSHFDTIAYDKDKFDFIEPISDQVNNSIAFNIVLKDGDVIHIEAGAHVQSDMNRHGVYVRTYHKDYLDAKPLIHYKNLIEYRIKEQVKHKSNQQIYFDIFNIDGSSANIANNIFRYKEDYQMAISADLEMRTPIINNNYLFDNQLVSGNKLLCYKNPELNTVWQQTDNYIPAKVDQYRERSTGTDTDWEIHEPFIKNIHHECHGELMYTELKTHFIDILSHQADDLPFGHNVAKSLDSYNYNGGTICEHNDRYDLFTSLMHQDHTNFISAVNFAKFKYEENLDGLYKSAIKQIPRYLIATHAAITSVQELYDKIIEQVVNAYTSNISLDHIFNDTTSYNNGVGVHNWVASLPILGIKTPAQPIVLKDDTLGIYKLRHHDGHLSNFKLQDEYNQLLLDNYGKLIDAYNSTIDITIPFNGAVRIKDYTLQLCILQYSQSDTPHYAKYGDYWYNPTTKELKVHTNVYTGISADEWHLVELDSCWNNISNSKIIEGLFLNIENALYKRAKEINKKIDIPLLLGAQSSRFFNNLTDRFLAYTKSVPSLAQPYAYDPTDAFTWNYIDVPKDPNATINYQINRWAAFWPEIYELQYGTSYPHLEPWVLQGYAEKPDLWDTAYSIGKDIEMWANIRAGIIHEYLPNPEHPVRTYSIISVNDTGFMVDGYLPNALLPPYINSTKLTKHSLVVGNIIPNTTTPTIGMQDKPERQWRESIDYNYDVLITLFILQPIKTFNLLFGSNNIVVNGLQIDKDLQKIPANSDVVFHGSSINGKKYISNGMNQWFINQLRADNNVSSISAFYNAWTQWVLKLSYQTDAIINEHSLLVDSPTFYITKDDFELKLKKSPGAKELVMHSLLVSLNKMGAYTAHINSGNLIPLGIGDDWEFRVDIPVLANNKLSYYDVCRYSITSVNIIHNYFTLNRITPLINGEDIIMYYDSPSMHTTTQYKLIRYDGDRYSLAAYDLPANDFLPIKMYDELVGYVNDIPAMPNDYDLWYDSSKDRIMQYRWNSDTWVSYSNTEYQFMIPTDSTNIVIYNDDVLLSSNDFILNNQKITINKSIAIGKLSVKMAIPLGTIIECIENPFYAVSSMNCPLMWNHIKVDTLAPLKILAAPGIILGVQGVIDFIDGYAYGLMQEGFVFNDYENPRPDDKFPDRVMGWQLEIEKFIDKTWSGFNNKFNTPVSNTSLMYQYSLLYDYIDINPFKYEFWINTPQGIISNILKGPFKDIVFTPLIYNSMGKLITNVDNIKIYRTDKQSHVTYPYIDGADYIGGVHLFIDYYEHVVKFNDYTVNGNLIYDPFLGINNENIIVSMNKHYESTRRPNIGGGFLMGNSIIDNIESNTQNFQDLYDTDSNGDIKKYTKNSRRTIGYDGFQYITQLDTQSKFLLWKGMINNKGTNHILNAYTQLSGIGKITADEVWLYKLGDYGVVNAPQEQWNHILSTDINRNDIRYYFTDSTLPTDIVNTFVQIKATDNARWNRFTSKPIMMDYVQVDTIRYLINQQAKLTNIDSKHTVKTIDRSTDNLRFVKIDKLSNKCELWVELNYDLFYVAKIADAKNGVFTIPSYVVGSRMLRVFSGGEELSIAEIGTGISTQIQISGNVTGDIAIYYQRGLLMESTHYFQLRPYLFEMVGDFLGDVDCLDICLFNFDHESIDANIIDTVNDVITIPLPHFDPSMGIYPKAINDVDYIDSIDPANYGDTFWNKSEVGRKWIDTKDLGYYCYSDNAVYPNISDQIALWGATSSWSHIDCYEWIESDISPSEWASYVARNSSFSASNGTRYVGQPLKILNVRRRDSVDAPWSDWSVEQNTYQIVDAFNFDIVNNTITFKVTLTIDPYKDNYSLFVNEILYNDYDVFMDTNILTTIEVRNIKKQDTIRLIRFADKPTTEQINLNPSTQLVSYQYAYKYNAVTHYDDLGVYSTKKYYFWVTGQIDRSHNNISTSDVEEIFLSNKSPYVFNIDVDKWVINNIMNSITSFAAFQLIQNKSLFNYTDYQPNLHNACTEWLEIREHSLSKVPQILWDKLVDTLTNRNASTDLKIFDAVNNTNHRYGIKPGQIMCDPQNALRSLLDLLYQNDFDISPENKDYFLDNYLLDTTDNIIKTMAYIYDRMSAPIINRIFFHILRDSLSYNDKMDDIIKTSIITVECESVVPSWN